MRIGHEYAHIYQLRVAAGSDVTIVHGPPGIGRENTVIQPVEPERRDPGVSAEDTSSSDQVAGVSIAVRRLYSTIEIDQRHDIGHIQGAECERVPTAETLSCDDDTAGIKPRVGRKVADYGPNVLRVRYARRAEIAAEMVEFPSGCRETPHHRQRDRIASRQKIEGGVGQVVPVATVFSGHVDGAVVHDRQGERAEPVRVHKRYLKRDGWWVLHRNADDLFVELTVENVPRRCGLDRGSGEVSRDDHVSGDQADHREADPGRYSTSPARSQHFSASIIQPCCTEVVGVRWYGYRTP